MGLFDSIQNPTGAPVPTNTPDQLPRKTVVFQEIPETLEQMQALPEASMKDPLDVAALTIAALCVYPSNKYESIRMLNFLKGPQPLTPYELSFLADRFRDSDYVARSYFDGATPQNNYLPQRPYSITVYELAHSRDALNEGYLTVNITSGGADSPRQIRLRTKPSTGEWFLWEQFVLSGIRTPDAANPWA
ncbi:MAG: hypothetical protein KBT07_04005 [Clostridiales bacterium]|nr:hypothetical protein [Candidatus Scatonaster coprocaballi]